ncbi:hypothetical protein ACWYRQ_14700 [Clostridioides difficile]
MNYVLSSKFLLMQEVINRLKKLKEAYGDDILIKHAIVPKGCYYKIKKDGSIVSFINDDEKNFQLNEEYPFFKQRIFYERMINANKCLNQERGLGKKIHSVTPYALIFKIETFNNLLFSDFLYSHFKKMKEDYNNSLNIEETITHFEACFDTIEEDCGTFNSKTPDKIFIFLDEDLELYKEAYNSYVSKKCFISEDTKVVVDGQIYGIPHFSINLNKGKPTLSNNPYNDFLFRLTLEDSMLLLSLLKIKNSSINELLNNDKIFNELELELEIGNNANDKSNEIVSIEMKADYSNKCLDFEESIILQSMFSNENIINLNIDRKNLLKKIDEALQIKNGVNNMTLEKALSLKKDNYNDFINRLGNLDLAQSIISNKDLLTYYFIEDKDISINKEIEKIVFYMYLEGIKNEKDLNKSSLERIRKKIDFMISILMTLYKEGGYKEMPSNLKKIWDKLISAKKGKEYEYEIESDEEFFFVSAQLLYWINTTGTFSSKTNDYIQNILSLRDSNQLKEKMIDGYETYLHNIPLGNNFANRLYSKLLLYKESQNIKIKGIYKYYFHSGLFGENINYTKC